MCRLFFYKENPLVLLEVSDCQKATLSHPKSKGFGGKAYISIFFLEDSDNINVRQQRIQIFPGSGYCR